jgi:hypothetical protein
VSFDALREMALGVAFDILSVPATVTLPNATVITTSVVWRRPRQDVDPFGTDLQNLGARKVLGILKTAVLASVPRGAVIAAPELDGGTIRSWRVDGYAFEVEPDHMWLIVVPTS